jgi:hypothetical protein
MKWYLILAITLVIAVIVLWDKIGDGLCSYGIGDGCGNNTYSNGNKKSLLDQIADAFYNPFPNGEAQGTSETYSGAVTETFTHPIDTLSSILGIND